MKVLVSAAATLLVTVAALPSFSKAALATSSKSAIAKPSANKNDREAFLALYGASSQSANVRPVLKSNGSNFPGAADLPDDSSLRIGSF